MTTFGVDTSVAIPLLVATHPAHAQVQRWAHDHDLALSGHALGESYAVLTRLPGDVRVSPGDAARLLSARFSAPLLLAPETATTLPEVLSAAQISGGAVYDALVGLAAKEHDLPLATRDGRATGTYEAVGARYVIVS